MPPRDDLPMMGFPSAAAFGTWLMKHHTTAPGMWLRIPKKGRGIPGPTYSEALDEALRFGWIDSQKASHDDDVYLQRFTPRAARSRWSKVNQKKVAALISAGRMAPAGQSEIDRAQADGRWDAAYDSMRTATVPPDLAHALAAIPTALKFFEGLRASQRFAILYSIQDAKRPATRERRIAKYVDLCAREQAPS